MDKEEAERWCREHKFEFMCFKYPGNDGREGYWVAGWAWPKDTKKDKVRIAKNGKTLEEVVEKAKKKYDEVTK